MSVNIELVNLVEPSDSLARSRLHNLLLNGGSLVLCANRGLTANKLLTIKLTSCVKLKGNRLAGSVLVKLRLLVLYLVNVDACDLAQLATVLEVLEKVEGALSEKDNGLPGGGQGQLKWVRQVVAERVPRVVQDADKLKPRVRVERKLSSLRHDFQELTHTLYTCLGLRNLILLVVVLMRILPRLVMVLNSIFVFGEH